MPQVSNTNTINKKRKAEIKVEVESPEEGEEVKSYEELLKELQEVRAENVDIKKELKEVKTELADVKEKLKAKDTATEESDDDDDEEDPTEADANNPWVMKLHELREYLIMNGNCDVPQKYPTNQKLSNWVKWQRQEYGKKKMTADKISKLECIGFTWGKKFPTPPTWNEHLDELKKYQKAMQHCNVPINPNNPSPLAKWISSQRFEYKYYFKKGKDSILTLDQIEQLNNIGFNWKGPRL